MSDPTAAPELSVVFPAFNEALRLTETLDSVRSYLERLALDYEILVVDDGSRDATAGVGAEGLARCRNGRLISFPENRGKGAAVRAGALEARGRFVLFSDVDLSTPIEEEARLRAALDKGADIAIGSRRLPGSRITKAQSGLRRASGRIFNLSVRALGLSTSLDTQCGFKMFRREAVRKIFPRLRISGFAFDVESLFLAKRAGLRIEELPVEWRNDDGSRLGVAGGLHAFLELVQIRWLHARESFPSAETVN